MTFALIGVYLTYPHVSLQPLFTNMSTALDRPAARVDKPTEKMGQMDHFFYSALNGAEDSMAKILDNRAKVPDITKKDTGGEYIDMASVNKDNTTMAKYFAIGAAGAGGGGKRNKVDDTFDQIIAA